jgi:hypothetical protein
MPKGAISNKKLSERRSIEEAWWQCFERDISCILRDLGYTRPYGKSKKWLQKPEFELNEGSYVFLVSRYLKSYTTAIEERREPSEKGHLSSILAIERLVGGQQRVKEEVEEKAWPSYAIEEFEKIVENSKGLEDAREDKSKILYHIMEIEALLGRIEKKAGATGQEAEARLAASLRDICRVHEPSELSDEQIKCFTDSLRALIEGWGELNREKVKWIRKRLLEVGLTWLPVTKKAEKDIAEAKKLAGINEH